MFLNYRSRRDHCDACYNMPDVPSHYHCVAKEYFHCAWCDYLAVFLLYFMCAMEVSRRIHNIFSVYVVNKIESKLHPF